MPTTELSFSDTGFDPTSAGAVTGDTVTVINTTAEAIELTFSCPNVATPLVGLTSPVEVGANSGSVSGVVSGDAANLAITFTAKFFDAVVDVALPTHRVTVTPETSTPETVEVQPGDGIVFYNESGDEVELEIDSPEQDPFGPDIGMNPTLAPETEIGGFVEARVANKKVMVTVKGSTSATSTINVGSGD